jgi:steroid 5-alpha reductase family enzyme
MADFMTNYGIIICYILLAVATLAAVVFPIIQFAQNPKNAKGALIGIGALVVLVGISYVLASDTNPSNMEITASAAKQVGTGLYAFYFLAGIAIVAVIYSEVAKLIK